MTPEEKLMELTGLTPEEFYAQGSAMYSPTGYNRLKTAFDARDIDAMDEAMEDIETARQSGEDTGFYGDAEGDKTALQEAMDAMSTIAKQAGMTGDTRYVFDPVKGETSIYVSPLTQDVSAIFTDTTSPELVTAFQKAAEQAGIVEDGYFDTEDYWGYNTQSLVNEIIQFGQNSFTVLPGTPEAEALIAKHAPNGFFGYENQANLNDELTLGVALFMESFDAFAKAIVSSQEKEEKLKRDEGIQQLVSQFGVKLSPTETGDLLEDYYQRTLNRMPTQEERDEYYSFYGGMHSQRMKDLISFYDANSAGETFETYAAPYRDEFGGVSVPQGERLIDFTVTNPQAELMQKVQEDTKGERALINQGNLQRQQTKELKKKMFSMVYG